MGQGHELTSLRPGEGHRNVFTGKVMLEVTEPKKGLWKTRSLEC